MVSLFRCVLQFGAWSYYTSKMNLTTDTSKINLESYEKNGEWEIVGTQVKIVTRQDTCQKVNNEKLSKSIN